MSNNRFDIDEFTADLRGLNPNLPTVIEVRLDKIRPLPNQPRKHFDEEKLQELADSIAEHGLIQPITVTDDPDDSEGFMLIAGERRWRATQLIPGKDTILAIRRDGSPYLLAVIENIQREDLDPFEEAEAYRHLMHEYNYTQEELGQAVGKRQNTLSEILSLNELPEHIRQEYRTSDIPSLSKSILVLISRAPKSRQDEIWRETTSKRLNVKQLRELVKQKKSPKKKPIASEGAAERAHKLVAEFDRSINKVGKQVYYDDFPEGSRQREELMEVQKRFNKVIDIILKGSDGDDQPKEVKAK